MAELTDGEIKILKKFVAQIKIVAQEIKKTDGRVREISISSMIKNALED